MTLLPTQAAKEVMNEKKSTCAIALVERETIMGLVLGVPLSFFFIIDVCCGGVISVLCHCTMMRL